MFVVHTDVIHLFSRTSATNTDHYLLLAQRPSANSSRHMSSQKEIYKRKIKELVIIDPYEAPQVLFTDIKCAEKLPDIEFGDIYS